jgi:aldehyde dehydrogenase (NAD+)
VGRVVAKAAAEHITPVTLELGGKSPVIVDKSAKMKTVVERIAMPKFSTNIGQICVSPDYVVIHKDREQEFYDGMKQHIEALFGKDAKQSPHYGRIINSNHVRRIGNILQGSKGEVVTGGLQEFDADARYVPPTIVKVSHADDPLLGEEIFGPVLPVMTFNNIEEAVDKVNAIDDHPLALYVFSQDKKATDYVLNNTTSGGACVNTALEHLLNANLPFGGVGSSGYGTSHGKHGFDEFTHRRAVLDQDTLILSGAAVPPQPPEKMYDFIVKATITGFLTEGQRNMLKAGLGTGAVAAAGMFFRSRL